MWRVTRLAVITMTALLCAACSEPSPISDFGNPSIVPTQTVPKTVDLTGTYRKVVKAIPNKVSAFKQTAGGTSNPMDVSGMLNSSDILFKAADGTCSAPANTSPTIVAGINPGQIFIYNFLAFTTETQTTVAQYNQTTGTFSIPNISTNISCSGKAAFANNGTDSQTVQLIITCSASVNDGSTTKSTVNPSPSITCESIFQKI